MQRLDATSISPATPYIYAVHAMRWGCPENHSYVVLATLRIEEALAAADSEEMDRGGKYGCEITRFYLGEKTVIRKPYNDKKTCYTCANLISRPECDDCVKFSKWIKK